ncbi:hypothetical protein PBY51_017009 [Eleginops maclovinus]|uniref:Uncharacterized protein n=1 Tax=Eleginops maclovinus TaxID=56733 RepID=A0AAN8A051_ELEMC|nr:hypothetical protein PBY51_017009 [Eleginops maclovinus]
MPLSLACLSSWESVLRKQPRADLSKPGPLYKLISGLILTSLDSRRLRIKLCDIRETNVGQHCATLLVYIVLVSQSCERMVFCERNRILALKQVSGACAKRHVALSQHAFWTD